MSRLLYDAETAAETLSVSRAHFYRHIKPELGAAVFSGSKVLYPHKALQRWVDKNVCGL